jgi:hypothetical protein
MAREAGASSTRRAKAAGGFRPSSKLWKLLTYKTAKGKLNILTDMIFHGHGTAGYIADEIVHTAIEGKFNARKAVRYGNAGRIFWGLAAGLAGLMLGAAVGKPRRRRKRRSFFDL